MHDDVESRLRQGLTLLAEHAPTTPSTLLLDAKRGGRRRRGRRLALAGTSVSALLAVAAAAAGIVVAVPHAGRQTSTIRPAGTASSPAPDPDQSAAYWAVTEDEEPEASDPSHVESWDARVGQDLTWTASEGYRKQPSYVDQTFGGPGLQWDDFWALPRTAPALDAWFRAHISSATPPRHLDAEEAVWLADLLHEPGPLALRQAAVTLLEQQAGTVTMLGTDDRGRAATVLSSASAPDLLIQAQEHVLFVDPATDTPLEARQTATGPQVAKADVTPGTVVLRIDYLAVGPRAALDPH